MFLYHHLNTQIMKIQFENTLTLSKIKVFMMCDNMILSPTLNAINEASNQHITKLIKCDNTFKGKNNSIMHNMISHENIDIIMIIGCGEKNKITREHLKAAGATITSKLNNMKIECADVIIEDNILSTNVIDLQTAAAYIAEGMKLRNYKFNKYFVDKKKDHDLTLKTVNIIVDNDNKANEIFKRYDATINGVITARDLVSEPGNIIYPESFAKKCLELSKFGIKVKILEQSDIEKLGMGALLGVAQGSVNQPQVVIMEWMGDQSTQETLALIGKGVTFDTGGINLKSSHGIGDMKYDMAGAAVVVGVMQAIAEQKITKNIVGFLGLVENMPSGSAQRPGDVVRSMSGQTIEIDNTDAEGRLVLSDVMWYAQTEYNCKMIIDLATLTGAINVALGDEFAGLFSNNDTLADQLIHAGRDVNELLWRMPLSDHYDNRINSEIADVRNTSRLPGAGATTAAQFLQRFLRNKNLSWAHLDIAGVTWTTNGELTNGLKGATGFGVRLLEQFITKYYV